MLRGSLWTAFILAALPMAGHAADLHCETLSRAACYAKGCWMMEDKGEEYFLVNESAKRLASCSPPDVCTYYVTDNQALGDIVQMKAIFPKHSEEKLIFLNKNTDGDVDSFVFYRTNKLDETSMTFYGSCRPKAK